MKTYYRQLRDESPPTNLWQDQRGDFNFREELVDEREPFDQQLAKKSTSYIQKNFGNH